MLIQITWWRGFIVFLQLHVNYSVSNGHGKSKFVLLVEKMNKRLRICSAKVFFWSTCAAIWIFGNPIKLQVNLTFNLLTKYYMLQLQPETLQKQRAYWHYFNICLVFFSTVSFEAQNIPGKGTLRKSKIKNKKFQGNIKRKTQKYIIVNESRFPINEFHQDTKHG